MSRVGMETVIDQVVAKLKADLPAKIAEINGAFNDEHVLATPFEDAYFPYLKIQRGFSRLPSLFIFPPISQMQEHAIGDEYKIARQFIVAVIDGGRDEADLTRKMYRWEVALFEILSANDALACGATKYLTTEYGQPQQEHKSGSLVIDVPLLFAVTTYETPK